MNDRVIPQPVLGPGNWFIRHGACKRGKRWPEYGVWFNMIRRCEQKHNKSYKNYGARGITVCNRWHDFDNFITDMGRRPSDAHTLERVNNNKGYSPSNCIWATRKEQAANKRLPKRRTVCLKGHDLSGENEYLRPDGKRGCKTCRRQNMKDYYKRLKSNEQHQSS